MKYRDSVCAVIRKPEGGDVLVCHRCGYPPEKGWQFPQGGYDQEKGLVAEVKRELREEIGTDDVEIVKISSRSYTYDFPEHARNARPGYRGQRQRWVLADFRGNDALISFSNQPAEFDRYEWVDPTVALERIVAFKRGVYGQALGDLGLV